MAKTIVQKGNVKISHCCQSDITMQVMPIIRTTVARDGLVVRLTNTQMRTYYCLGAMVNLTSANGNRSTLHHSSIQTTI